MYQGKRSAREGDTMEWFGSKSILFICAFLIASMIAFAIPGIGWGQSCAPAGGSLQQSTENMQQQAESSFEVR
jgi:hypothetical protein